MGSDDEQKPSIGKPMNSNLTRVIRPDQLAHTIGSPSPQIGSKIFDKIQARLDELSQQIVELTSLQKSLNQAHDSANFKEAVTSARTAKEAITHQTLEINKLREDVERLEAREKQVADSVKHFATTIDENISQANEDFAEAMEAAKRAFAESNAQKRPVELWAKKQTEHETMASGYLWWFKASLIAIAAATLAFIALIIFLPTAMDHLIAPIGCDLATGTNCSGFSMKGLVVTAAVLTFFTILLWFARLQMKLYLAERHLALDARERRAFSETYVGLLAEGDTSREAAEQRGLVYAALFRPGADGTVREEGGIDPAISAALSKLLTK